jgi:predicted nuclease of restriction endonuclease-like (RecB) superfamily
MNSMLFERTSLSTDKEAVLKKQIVGLPITAEEVFRNPYMLEFLGLEAQNLNLSLSEYVESIITNHGQQTNAENKSMIESEIGE